MNSFPFSVNTMAEAILRWNSDYFLFSPIFDRLHCKYTEFTKYLFWHFQRDLVTNTESVLNSGYLHYICIGLAYARTRVYTRMRMHKGPGHSISNGW